MSSISLLQHSPEKSNEESHLANKYRSNTAVQNCVSLQNSWTNLILESMIGIQVAGVEI